MHDKDDNHDDAEAAASDMSYNEFGTTIFKNVLGILPLFISVKYVLVTISE